MTNAPERIWIEGAVSNEVWKHDKQSCLSPHEYTRTDLIPAMIDEAVQAEREAIASDKEALLEIVDDLLTRLDDWDRARAEEARGHTMHVYGMTPDWFVNAAHWVCYGCGYNDPRARKGGEA